MTSNTEPKLLNAMRRWLERLQIERDLRHESIAGPSRIRARKEYAARKAMDGGKVRPYRFHDHETASRPESGEQCQQRQHRNRQRTYRGVTTETVRPYIDLSEMTPDEKAEHKREQSRLRQSERRARLKSKSAPVSGRMADLLSDDELAILEFELSK